MPAVKFSQFIGQENARLGLILNAIDPACGGMLLIGGKGRGKSTLARLARGIFPSSTPFVELPLNVTEDSLLGCIDLEQTLAIGRRTLQPGIISRANNGIIFADDINMLSPDLAALLMEPQGRGEEIIERDGLQVRHACRFSIFATMNPEEVELSAHLLDRFGLCAVMEELQDSSRRLSVIRLAAQEDYFRQEPDMEIQARIAAARTMLGNICLADSANDHLLDVVQRNFCAGHRGDLYLFYAARAYAAFSGEPEIRKEHIDRVEHLVYSHRRLQVLDQKEDHSGEKKPQDNGDDGKRQPHSGTSQADDASGREPQDQRNKEGKEQADASPRQTSGREEVMHAGEAFSVRRLIFRKDRLKRKADGRRTRTRVKGRSGRYVRSVMSSTERDIAVDATLRICAPYQNIRGRRDRLLIEPDDLRYRQRERKMGHLVLFVVDGSASMGAKQRMIETKGAIRSLLTDCYRKRDKVAMIVFRRERAEIVLPPTSSVEMAAKRLSLLPVGGKTPLAAGLLETWRLVRKTAIRSPETRVVVILATDGRGNHSLGGTSGGEEIRKLAWLLAAEPSCDIIVVDTENKGSFLRFDKALDLAKQLNADYFTIEALRAENLTRLALAGTAGR
jgi:magnesium chelatase subunit D